MLEWGSRENRWVFFAQFLDVPGYSTRTNQNSKIILITSSTVCSMLCDSWQTPDTTSLLIATTTHSTNNMFYISSIKSSILVLLLVIAVSIRQSVLAFVITSSPNPLLRKVDATIIQTNKQHSLFQPSSVSTSSSYVSSLVVLRNDWAGFGVLEDDDDEDIFIAAKEEDTQEEKAEAGASLKAPDIEDNSSFAGIAPLFVPAGSQLSMDEETVLGVLNACRDEIGTVFGYTAENRGVSFKRIKLNKKMQHIHSTLPLFYYIVFSISSRFLSLPLSSYQSILDEPII